MLLLAIDQIITIIQDQQLSWSFPITTKYMRLSMAIHSRYGSSTAQQSGLMTVSISIVEDSWFLVDYHPPGCHPSTTIGHPLQGRTRPKGLHFAAVHHLQPLQVQGRPQCCSTGPQVFPWPEIPMAHEPNDA